MPLGDTLAMTRWTRLLHNLMRFACPLLTLVGDGGRFLLFCLRPSPALAAENMFLRKQLALYQERSIKPRRATNAIRTYRTEAAMRRHLPLSSPTRANYR